MTTADAAIPLYARFPRLAALPRASLGTFPSPVQRLGGVGGGGALWVKRDDLNAPAFGGNKVRALEFLLARVAPGDLVVTLGGDGSTHVLATAAHAARLGAGTVAVRWTHDMNPLAHRVGREAAERCERIVPARTAVDGIVRWWLATLAAERGGRRTHFVPLGGTNPLGILGHLNAGLELAGQIRDGLLPAPARVVVPLGSGGTAAGLALGLTVAGVEATVVAARVVPRLAATRRGVLALAERTRRLVERLGGERCPRVSAARVVVRHDVYGGAYGRALPAAAADAAAFLAAGGPPLDATYGEKALAAALRLAREAPGPTLFWVTFDARWMAPAGAGGRFTPPTPPPTFTAPSHGHP